MSGRSVGKLLLVTWLCGAVVVACAYLLACGFFRGDIPWFTESRAVVIRLAGALFGALLVGAVASSYAMSRGEGLEKALALPGLVLIYGALMLTPVVAVALLLWFS